MRKGLLKYLLGANYVPGTCDTHSWVTKMALQERTCCVRLLAPAGMALAAETPRPGWVTPRLMELGCRGPAILAPLGRHQQVI